MICCNIIFLICLTLLHQSISLSLYRSLGRCNFPTINHQIWLIHNFKVVSYKTFKYFWNERISPFLVWCTWRTVEIWIRCFCIGNFPNSTNLAMLGTSVLSHDTSNVFYPSLVSVPDELLILCMFQKYVGNFLLSTHSSDQSVPQNRIDIIQRHKAVVIYIIYLYKNL